MAPEFGARIDSASRVIKASPQTVYQAHMDAAALVSWLPPQGMKARLEACDPREGGTYRMVLTYDQAEHRIPGKSSEHSDVVCGRFLELVPDERIVQSVEFESNDPRLRGEMKMTWILKAVPQGSDQWLQHVAATDRLSLTSVRRE